MLRAAPCVGRVVGGGCRVATSRCLRAGNAGIAPTGLSHAVKVHLQAPVASASGADRGHRLVSPEGLHCLTVEQVRPAPVEPVNSGASRRRGGRVTASIRECLQEHRLEEASIAQGLDQTVAASLVLEDLDAAVAGDAPGVEQVEGIFGADVDLVPSLAAVGWEDVKEVEGCFTTIR